MQPHKNPAQPGRRGIPLSQSARCRFNGKQPGIAGRLPLWRPLANCCEKVLITVLLLALTIELTQLDLKAGLPSQGLETADGSGSGVTVRSVMLNLWVPESSLNLLSHSGLSERPTYQELQAALERRGQQDLWYAFSTRGEQLNGGLADVTFIRYPYRDPSILGEFLDVLATAAGNSPPDPASYNTGPAVHVLPDDLARHEPREIVQKFSWVSPRRSDRVQATVSADELER